MRLFILFSALLVCSGVAPLAQVAERDFAAERYTLVKSKEFNDFAIGIAEKKLIQEAMKAWEEGDILTTFKRFDDVLDIYPLSIEAHRRIADSYAVIIAETELDPETAEEFRAREDRHRKIADGIVASILASGDGKTPETAYVVICVPEEYWTLSYLGLEKRSQILIKKKRRYYDSIATTDSSGNRQTVYFDVTLFYKKKK